MGKKCYIILLNKIFYVHSHRKKCAITFYLTKYLIFIIIKAYYSKAYSTDNKFKQMTWQG